MSELETVPAELVFRFDSIFMDVPGVDTVELGALMMDMAKGWVIEDASPYVPPPAAGRGKSKGREIATPLCSGALCDGTSDTGKVHPAAGNSQGGEPRHAMPRTARTASAESSPDELRPEQDSSREPASGHSTLDNPSSPETHERSSGLWPFRPSRTIGRVATVGAPEPRASRSASLEPPTCIAGTDTPGHLSSACLDGILRAASGGGIGCTSSCPECNRRRLACQNLVEKAIDAALAEQERKHDEFMVRLASDVASEWDERLKAAVAAEREACAKVASDFLCRADEAITDAIRSRSTPPPAEEKK